MSDQEGAAPTATPDTPPVSDAAKGDAPHKRHVGRNIGLAILALVLVGAGVVVWWGLSSTDAKPYPSPIDHAMAERNTVAYGALVAIPLGDPLVSMQEDLGRVVYDLRQSPANATWATEETGAPATAVAPDDVQRLAIGALAEAVAGVARFEVVQMDGEATRTSWSVDASDVRAFFAGELTVEQFEARITKA